MSDVNNNVMHKNRATFRLNWMLSATSSSEYLWWKPKETKGLSENDRALKKRQGAEEKRQGAVPCRLGLARTLSMRWLCLVLHAIWPLKRQLRLAQHYYFSRQIANKIQLATTFFSASP